MNACVRSLNTSLNEKCFRKILEKIKTYILCPATDNNILRRMRFVCWINKATTHTLRMRNTYCFCRPSQWPRGLMRWSAAARLLGLRVRIQPPGVWMFVSIEYCVLSGRGLSVGLIIRAEEFYRVWYV
jgi:hypothetical protein